MRTDNSQQQSILPTIEQTLQPDPQEINELIASFKEKRYTETLTIAQLMTERFPLYGLGWLLLGAAFKQISGSAEALVPIQKAVALIPDNAEAHNSLGNVLRDIGRLDDALASYRWAVEIKPNFADAHNNLGIVYQSLGQLDDAVTSFSRASSIEPNFAIAHNNLGVALKNLGRHDDAVPCFRRAIKINPDYASAHNNLGITLKNLGQLDAAAASYKRALEIKQDLPEAHFNLGNILKNLGRFNEAEDSYRHALEIKPGEVNFHYELGNLLYDLGKLDDAAMHFKSCLAIDPEDSLGIRLLLARLGLEPMPLRASESQLRKLYVQRSGIWDKSQSYRGHELVAEALKKCARLHESQLDILDAGCGTGLVGALIRDLANRLDGVDMSTHMLEKARQKNIYDQIYLGDLVSFMESHPNMYDAITCAATLIHFGDLLPVFDAAAVSLRDDGLFVFTLFLNNNESNDNEVVVAQEGNLAGSGCFAHGSNHVRRLAESAGFMIDVLESEIHEYHGPQKTIPIMGLIVALRRHTRMVGIDVQL